MLLSIIFIGSCNVLLTEIETPVDECSLNEARTDKYHSRYKTGPPNGVNSHVRSSHVLFPIEKPRDELYLLYSHKPSRTSHYAVGFP